MALSTARIFCLALAVRAAYLAAIIGLDAALPDNDSSALLVRRSCGGGPPAFASGAPRAYGLHSLLVWDSVFFERVARCGYEFEQYHAFLPAFPAAAYALASAVAGGGGGPPSPAAFAAAGVALNALLGACSAALLARLTAAVLRDERSAAVAALFFILNPASVFHAVAYTEALFTFLSFAGLYALHARGAFWPAAAAFAASSAARSNGILSAGFLLHASARRAIADWRAGRRGGAAAAAARGAVGAALVVAPYAWLQYSAWAAYCGPAAAGPRRPWCDGALPSVYGFVQGEYWGVGFLKYYQLKQIPNFLIAAPVLALTFAAVAAYARRNGRHFAAGGLLQPDALEALFGPPAAGGRGGRKGRVAAAAPDEEQAAAAMGRGGGGGGAAAAVRRSQRLAPGERGGSGGERTPPPPPPAAPAPAAARGFFRPEATVFVVHWGAMALLALLAMHVQVATRFLSSCAPIYWYAAHLQQGSPRAARWLWAYCLAYMTLGALMMPNFYPWT